MLCLLYILPVINIIIEIFQKHFAFQLVTNINLVTFFGNDGRLYIHYFYGLVYRKRITFIC